MRNKYSMLLMIISISIGYSNNYLAVISNLTPENRPYYHIFRQISNDYLAIVSDDQLQQLEEHRADFTVLDNDPLTKMYFLIANSESKEYDVIPYGKILKRYDAFFLFQTTPEFKEAVRAVPLRMEQLEFTPITFDSREQPAQRIKQKQENPIIVKILNEISIDTLRGYVKKLQSFKTRHSASADNKDIVCPWLAEVLKPFCDSVYMQTVSSSCGPNVIGIKKGKKNPSLTQYCIIGGHLDGVIKNGPHGAAGADDNATGTAAVLECARVFKNYTFENTVVFALFNGEENGFLGSKRMANDMKNKGHKAIGGVVTYDMLGHSSSSSKNLVQLEGFDNSQANKDFVTKYMQGIVDTYTKMKTYQYLKGFGSDHVSFKNAGFVSILLIEREYDHPAYHKDFDTLDCPVGLNDMELFENITKTGTAAIADLAVPVDNTNITGNHIQNNSLTGITISSTKNGVISIAISQPLNQMCSINIYSAQGKIIRSLTSVNLNTRKTITIPLTKNNTSVVSNGMYVIELKSAGILHTQKVVVF